MYKHGVKRKLFMCLIKYHAYRKGGNVAPQILNFWIRKKWMSIKQAAVPLQMQWWKQQQQQQQHFAPAENPAPLVQKRAW
jgi:hypothetical protein